MKNRFAEKRGFRLAPAALPPRYPVGSVRNHFTMNYEMISSNLLKSIFSASAGKRPLPGNCFSFGAWRGLSYFSIFLYTNEAASDINILEKERWASRPLKMW